MVSLTEFQYLNVADDHLAHAITCLWRTCVECFQNATVVCVQQVNLVNLSREMTN